MARKLGTLLLLLLVAVAPAPARACGGFFCGQQPVDQQAERILFAIGPTHTDMVVQIAYRGAASDFAWVLPIGFVPATSDLGTFSPLALTQLDANTAPIFVRPGDPECGDLLLNGGGSDADTPGVTVHLTDVVGPYEVAVIEGSDAGELVGWLRDNDYRITDRMIPFVDLYVAEGMKLLALRLTGQSGVEDIEPFRIRMPTRTPSIPIRLTAIAAEPEMGILVFVFADRRYGPSNWSELEIDPGTIRFSSHAWPAETDYLARVAREADLLGGTAFVTELAGSTTPLLDAVRASTPRDEEQMRAQRDLEGLLEPHPYFTRMYARLSAEEMTTDPGFSPHGGGDVERTVLLSRYVDGEDMCLGGGLDPCDFAFCGNGSCSVVEADTWPYQIAGCDCPGSTVGRATFGALGQVTVACVDPSRSVINPGDRDDPDSPPLGDPCRSYNCFRGVCLAVNMTPTCACDDGAVAVGFLGSDGGRMTRCVRPDEVVELPMPMPPMPPAIPVDAGRGETPPGRAPAREGVFAPGGGGCACEVRTGERWPVGLAVVGLLFVWWRRRGR